MDYKQIDEHSAVIRTLKENDIKIKPKGYSMYPLFVPGRDYAVITHIEPDTRSRYNPLIISFNHC